MRQIKRIVRRYRTLGIAGLISKKRGQASNRRLSEETKHLSIELIGTHYRDFGPTLACEKLSERHGLPLSVESTRKLDVFGDNIGDNRALIGVKGDGSKGLGFELRPTDVLAYISPAFAGVTAAFAKVNMKEGNTKSTDKQDSAVSLAVMYDVAPFYASVAHELHTLDATIGVDAEESANRLGFGFTQDAFSVGVVYEKTTDNFGTVTPKENKYGRNAYYVSGKYNIGNSAVKLAYGKAGVMGTGTSQTWTAARPRSQSVTIMG